MSEYLRYAKTRTMDQLRSDSVIMGSFAERYIGMNWISVREKLPEDGQRVLAFLPKNDIYLPGNTGQTRYLPVIFLRFEKDFFGEKNPKRTKFGAHFWLGEGQSNHYFDDVTHWMAVPDGPDGEVELTR